MATHTTGLVPMHAPAWQLSIAVQALPSVHAVPSLAAGFEHTPVVVSQTPTAWH